MIRKLFIVSIRMTLFISAFAADKDLEKDITLVSYEQSWKDTHGTIALKNNTEEEVRNVVCVITYLDMSGNEVDYEEFNKEVSIAPGMTKKINITAYEKNRNYHYYKSEGLYDNTSFKIKFQLKDYNVDQKEVVDTGVGVWSFLAIIILFLVIGVSVGLFVLVAVMAKKRNRNAALWVLLSLIATPFLIIIILLCIGEYERNSIDKTSIR